MGGSVDYWLGNQIVQFLRQWMLGHGSFGICCIITESSPGDEELDYQITYSELSEDALRAIPSSLERVFTAQDFSWAIHVDHEGSATVAGPSDFIVGIERAWAGPRQD